MNTLNVKCFDNSQYANRYTIVYLDHLTYATNLGNYYHSLSSDGKPTDPQGISMHNAALLGNHLGDAIAFTDLPPALQSFVKQWHMAHDYQDVIEGRATLITEQETKA